MSDYSRACHIAAHMVGDGDPGRLHAGLVAKIRAVEDLCAVDCTLLDTSTIAVIIDQWRRDNPGARAYGE